MSNGVDEPPGKKAMTIQETIDWLKTHGPSALVYTQASNGQWYPMARAGDGPHEVCLQFADVPAADK